MSGLTTEGVLAFFGPILVSAVAAWFAYRQSVKVTQETNKYEGRKMTLTEIQAVNTAQGAEIERIREDRDEDERRFMAKVEKLEALIATLESDRRDQTRTIARLRRG